MSKKIITTPFDRKKIPPRQNLFFMPFIWTAAYFITRFYGFKGEKIRMEGLKPPFIVLGNHLAFMDFVVTPLMLFPFRANYISELEGFEYYGGKFYRQLGALGTRKFVNDMCLIENIRRVVERGDIIVIYPEARYTNDGTSAIIPQSVGKLCKMLKVPVVTLNMRGNYLRSPIWNTHVRKQAKLSATMQQLYTAEEVEKATATEINRAVKEALVYDEYKYQKENKIAITYKKRAEGLEKVLYQCPKCKSQFKMTSQNAAIRCSECGAEWIMNEYGELVGSEGKIHIPDWYEWERKQVIEEINMGKYHFKGKVHIESLPNEYNFIDLKEGVLEHNNKGFYLTFKDFGEDKEKTLFFSSKECFSLHTEYDYRNKGVCITLSTLDNTYFVFPLCTGFNPTKLQFATEYLWEKKQL